MSDGETGRGEQQVSQRFAEVEDELRRGESLSALMAEQWRGMVGMASMFVATIALAMYIRPYYDVGELHAFGASGATQVRYVAIELLAIFAFTALIIFLARWGKEFIIKYGMYAVLSLAMLYTMVPLAHMLVLDFDTEPFEITSTTEINGDLVGAWGDDGFILAQVDDADVNTTVNITAWDSSNEYASPTWSMNHAHNVWDPNAAVTMTSAGDDLVFASVDYTWVVDGTTGDLKANYTCYTWVDGVQEYLSHLTGGCHLSVLSEDSLYVVNAFDEMVRFQTFETAPGVIVQEGGRWNLGDFNISDGVLTSHLLKDDQWFLVTPSKAGAVLLEQSSGALDDATGIQKDATMLFELQPEMNELFSASDIGYSPFLELNFTEVEAMPETREQRMVLLGETGGRVTGVEWNGTYANESAFDVQERMQLDGLVDTVTSVRLTDMDESGFSDMLITGATETHWLYTTSLVERGTFPVAENSPLVFFAIDEEATYLVTLTESDGSTTLKSGELTTEMFPLYGLQLLMGPTVAGIAITVLLLILLVVHSEWYVVNTTGVLLGAGVCVMLGVTFVPALAMLFMILAAVYDFWAVYRSKHMLDLADTMIGLRLPILLVAPQDADYSLIEETEGHKRVQREPVHEASTARPQRPARKKSEAMFMGLGDVIFPGMLVLSAMQWLDPSVAFQVAMSTLVGGLLGYLALMTYVARGKAQAGLPLLNGGAILGYLIGGMLFLGSEILSFNISW